MNGVKKATWVVCLAFAVAASGSATVASPQRSTREIMQRKLDVSQNLLRALVLARYNDIHALSGELDSLSEYQSWFVLPTPEYAQYTREFREAAKSMQAASMSRDLSAAYEAYTSMVGTCLECHDYMR